VEVSLAYYGIGLITLAKFHLCKSLKTNFHRKEKKQRNIAKEVEISGNWEKVEMIDSD
jgi:hypothetical protein